MNEKKPFEIKYDHKRDFRDWIRDQFPHLKTYAAGLRETYPEFTGRFEEVHQAATRVFDIIMTRSAPILQEYYAPDWRRLQELHRTRDTVKYASRIEVFLDAVDVE